MEHFTYLSPFTSYPEVQKFVTAILVGGIVLGCGSLFVSRLTSEEKRRDNLIPSERLSLVGIVDLLMESFVAYHDSILGKENRQHVVFHASVFFFILCANLLGLVPGIPAATTTVWVTVGLALVAFTYFNVQGVKAHGARGYFSHFLGPVIWLAFLMLPVELFSTCLRLLTLNLRLYWNITADHMVLENLTNVLGIGAFPVYILGFFVSFMQAFVFTTLSMVYVMLATEHEEGEDSQH
jgi:F-type H+-transporting ATPase subunit a